MDSKNGVKREAFGGPYLLSTHHKRSSFSYLTRHSEGWILYMYSRLSSPWWVNRDRVRGDDRKDQGYAHSPNWCGLSSCQLPKKYNYHHQQHFLYSYKKDCILFGFHPYIYVRKSEPFVSNPLTFWIQLEYYPTHWGKKSHISRNSHFQITFYAKFILSKSHF